LAQLFGRHSERLRKTVRLRLDHRLRDRFNSSAVLDLVLQEAARRVGEYQPDRARPFFLWLRQLTGQAIQGLPRQHLASPSSGWGADGGQELSLYTGALPEANSVSLAAQLLGHMTSATQAAIRADMQLRLQEALNSMDPLDREVLTLCHFEELSNDEAALALGIEKASATQRYLRALKRLKEIL